MTQIQTSHIGDRLRAFAQSLADQQAVADDWWVAELEALIEDIEAETSLAYRLGQRGASYDFS